MGIFSVTNSLLFSEDANVELPLEVEKIENPEVDYASIAPEKNEDPLAQAGEACAQNEANWNALMTAIGMHELQYFKENGTEIIYEGAKIEAFKKNVIEFFEKLKKKIHAIVLNVLADIQSRVLKSGKFINGHEEEVTKGFELLKKNKITKEIKIYEFNNLDWNAKESFSKMGGEDVRKRLEAVNTSSSYTGKIGETNKGTISLDILRAKSMPGCGKTEITADGFDAAITEYFRGSVSPKSIKFVEIGDVKKYINVLKAFNGTKEIKKAYKEFERSINDLIKSCKKIKGFEIEGKDTGKENQKSMNYLQIDIQNAKNMLNIMQKVFGGMMSAYKAQHKQARSICLACIHGNNNFAESTSTESSFLSNVQFI